MKSKRLYSVHWRHNEHDGVSYHQPHYCLVNRLCRRSSKKTSKLRVTGLCKGNSPVTGEFPTQRASNAENVSIWWRHHVQPVLVFPAGENCRATSSGREYSGHVSWTRTGITCQRWDTNTPHIPNYNFVKVSAMPEASLSAAENFCRNPDPTESIVPNGPWCYTTNPAIRWMSCAVPWCQGKSKPEYSGWTKSTTCLLMPRLLASLGPQQQDQWIYSMMQHLSSTRKVVKYLRHYSVEKL